MATITQQPVRSGRGAEILLLLLGTLVGVGGFVLTSLNRLEYVSSEAWSYLGVFVALSLVMYGVVRWRAPYADPVLLPVAIALNGVGLAMIYRLDMSYVILGQKDFVVQHKQLLWTAVSIFLAAAVLFIIRDHRSLRRYTYTFMVISFVLLVMPIIPGLGKEINGAKIWISLFGLSFQPAELAKITLAIFFAGYLVNKRDSLALAGKKILKIRLPRVRDLGPIIVAWVLSLAVLVLQKDLGTSLMLFGLFVIMLYVATDKVSWMLIGAALFVPAAYAMSKVFSHVGDRFTVWQHAMEQAVYERPFGGSYQMVQSWFSLASGGLTGAGWGKGYPQLVPLANSDFIVSALGEELGITGLVAILLLYLVLIERGMRLAMGVRDGFGKLLASGLVFVIGLQVFVVVGGVSGLIPHTGLTTPFLSYGGSSLLANWIIMALLIRISDGARNPAAVVVPA